jgi:hypothetical protein
MLRFRTLLILIAAIAVAVWLWQRGDPQHFTSPDSSNSSKSAIAPNETGADGHVPQSASTPADDRPTIASDSGGTASTAFAARAARSASVRLDVHAPASARVGDLVTITIDAEALGGIRDLSFTLVYDGRMLEFVSSSPGSFVQQASAPATLSAEDPSSGSVLVHMEINNGGLVAGAGTVVVLEFNALHAGTSPIALRDVSLPESGRSSSSTDSAERTASIIIE